jgi:uncharacterized protein (TIGR02246 family)
MALTFAANMGGGTGAMQVAPRTLTELATCTIVGRRGGEAKRSCAQPRGSARRSRHDRYSLRLRHRRLQKWVRRRQARSRSSVTPSCSALEDMSAHQTGGDARSAIDAINRDFMQAYIRGDAAGVASLYTVDAQLLPPRSDFIAGRDAITRYWHQAMKIGIRKLETTELEIHGEAADEVGRYTMETADGREADAGKYIVVWKFEDGVWRMHRDIWTTSRSP